MSASSLFAQIMQSSAKKPRGLGDSLSRFRDTPASTIHSPGEPSSKPIINEELIRNTNSFAVKLVCDKSGKFTLEGFASADKEWVPNNFDSSDEKSGIKYKTVDKPTHSSLYRFDQVFPNSLFEYLGSSCKASSFSKELKLEEKEEVDLFDKVLSVTSIVAFLDSHTHTKDVYDKLAQEYEDGVNVKDLLAENKTALVKDAVFAAHSKSFLASIEANLKSLREKIKSGDDKVTKTAQKTNKKRLEKFEAMKEYYANDVNLKIHMSIYLRTIKYQTVVDMLHLASTFKLSRFVNMCSGSSKMPVTLPPVGDAKARIFSMVKSGGVLVLKTLVPLNYIEVFGDEDEITVSMDKANLAKAEAVKKMKTEKSKPSKIAYHGRSCMYGFAMYALTREAEYCDMMAHAYSMTTPTVETLFLNNICNTVAQTTYVVSKFCSKSPLGSKNVAPGTIDTYVMDIKSDTVFVVASYADDETRCRARKCVDDTTLYPFNTTVDAINVMANLTYSITETMLPINNRFCTSNHRSMEKKLVDMLTDKSDMACINKYLFTLLSRKTSLISAVRGLATKVAKSRSNKTKTSKTTLAKRVAYEEKLKALYDGILTVLELFEKSVFNQSAMDIFFGLAKPSVVETSSIRVTKKKTLVMSLSDDEDEDELQSDEETEDEALTLSHFGFRTSKGASA